MKPLLPRVLVMSVSCWSDAVGANTYSELFAHYPVERLANLYIREEAPDSGMCRRYFRISESKVLHSILNRHIKTGRELRDGAYAPDESDIGALQETRSRYERHRRTRPWSLLYGREIAWLLGRWKTPELDEFIDSFAPDVVVFGMEGYIHFNRIVRYVIKRSGSKGIGYFYDDNFTYRQKPWNLGYRIYRFFQRRDLRKTAKTCSAFFAISPKTKAECDAFFGVDSIILTKPARVAQFEGCECRPPVRMLYSGNLLYGRMRSLRLLSDALARVNANGSLFELHVYSTTALSETETRGLDPAIRIHAAVAQSTLPALQKEADVLLFLEDLAGPDRLMARLSFSTKLTEYLSSGKCILAIGDARIAPMEYLRAEDAAICATSREELLLQLERIAGSPGLVPHYARRARECCLRNHDALVMERRLFETLMAVVSPLDSHE